MMCQGTLYYPTIILFHVRVYCLVLRRGGLHQRVMLVVGADVVLRCQRLEDFLHDQRVDVLGDLVEQQEVSKSLQGGVLLVGQASRDQRLVHLSIGTRMDDVDPHLVRYDGEEAIEEPDCGHRRQKHEPEVEEDVDLLVDDVEGKDAEGVMLLEAA